MIGKQKGPPCHPIGPLLGSSATDEHIPATRGPGGGGSWGYPGGGDWDHGVETISGKGLPLPLYTRAESILLFGRGNNCIGQQESRAASLPRRTEDM